MRAFCCSVPHNVEWDNYKRSDTCIAFAYQIASVSQQQRWGDLAPTSEISSLWISGIILHMLKHCNRHWVFDHETARHWHKHLGCNSRYNLRTRTQYSQLNLTWDSFVLVKRSCIEKEMGIFHLEPRCCGGGGSAPKPSNISAQRYLQLYGKVDRR